MLELNTAVISTAIHFNVRLLETLLTCILHQGNIPPNAEINIHGKKPTCNHSYLFVLVYDERDFSALIIITSTQRPAVTRQCFY